MAKKVEFELNLKGLNELMKSPEMQAALDKKGAEVVQIAGEGYNKRTHVADYVAITNVYPESKKAKKDNMDNNTLLKALYSAKG